MNSSKIAKHFVIRVLLCFILASALIGSPRGFSSSNPLSEEIISKEIVTATSLIPGKYTPVVKKYLHNHIHRYPEATEILLGKKTLYFPIFEEILKANGLPEDLKYLPIIESSLNPNARSYVGATGLWQFMKGTAEMHGLKVNHHVDERKNPIRATEAAVQHLKKLYAIYGDWALTLAAYNSGPGNVNKAIRRAGSRDYWNIRSYLPKETRGYVPVYIAVNYLFKNHTRFDLVPRLPELDLQITAQLKVHDHLSFKDIAAWTELPMELIRQLNPGFTRDYVPGSYKGYTLILPRRVIDLVKSHLRNLEENIHNEIINPIPGSYQRFVLEASAGEKIIDIANYFNIKVQNLYDWNGSHLGDILASDMPLSIFVYEPREEGIVMNIPRPRVVHRIKPIPGGIVHEVRSEVQTSLPLISYGESIQVVYPVIERRRRIKLDRGQSLNLIIKSIPDLSLEKLMALNDLEGIEDFRIGMYLYIE